MIRIYAINKRDTEREAAYLAALDWLDQLEPPTEQRYHKLTRNLHRADGTRLVELDEVVQAALAGELKDAMAVSVAAEPTAHG